MRPIILIIFIIAVVIGASTAILYNMINLELQKIGIFNFKVVISCMVESEDCFVNGQQLMQESGLVDRSKGYVVLVDDRPDKKPNDEKNDEDSSGVHDDAPDKKQIRLLGKEELAQYEGCPPSFWVSATNSNSRSAGWPSGYLPDQKFGEPSYFNNAIAISSGKDPTLLASLNSQGDGINKLARHAVAALLNAAHPEIEYPLSITQIISLTYEAIKEQNYDVAEKFAIYNNLGDKSLCKSHLLDPSDPD